MLNDCREYFKILIKRNDGRVLHLHGEDNEGKLIWRTYASLSEELTKDEADKCIELIKNSPANIPEGAESIHLERLVSTIETVHMFGDEEHCEAMKTINVP